MTSSPRPTRFHGRVPGAAHACAMPGCAEPGEFRAPLYPAVSGEGPPPWRWLCLDHVREFNAGYNYFKGMSVDEIYAAQSPEGGWESETRAFRAAGSADLPPRWSDFKDPLDAMGARFKQQMNAARQRQADPRFSRDEQRALGVMGLSGDTDRRALRQRYAELLRRFHPDRNGGDRSHESRLQAVVEAYQLLKTSRAFA